MTTSGFCRMFFAQDLWTFNHRIYGRSTTGSMDVQPQIYGRSTTDLWTYDHRFMDVQPQIYGRTTTSLWTYVRNMTVIHKKKTRKRGEVQK